MLNSLYQSEVTSSLACSHGPGNSAHNRIMNGLSQTEVLMSASTKKILVWNLTFMACHMMETSVDNKASFPDQLSIVQ